MKTSAKRVVGIDLGTTFSAIAVLDENTGAPTTIPNSDGELTTPSVILFESPKDAVVGTQAKRAASAEPGRVAIDAKRYMGERHYPHLILDKKYSPQALCSIILRKLKQDAEAKIGPVGAAVITVPAYFDERRRQATMQAGKLAGLEVIDILNEPTAAALAYVFRGYLAETKQAPGAPAKPTAPRTMVVYDLGGGTFDVTVLRVEGKQLTVLATAGDVRLGGRDWDERLFNHLADHFCREKNGDPREDEVSRQQLMQHAEELKKDLSRRKRVPFTINHAGQMCRGDVERSTFETATADLLFRTESRLLRVIKDAGLTLQQVDEVIAVGGSSRMPQVLEMLRRVTGKEPNCTLSPDEAIAHGAAIYAAMHAAGESPVQVESPKTNSDKADDATESDEDPVHAGPGLLARLSSPLLKLLRSIRASNVSAHSLGVVVEDSKGRKRVSRLIERNSPLPAAAAKYYATVTADQKRVSVQVVEGESEDVADCILIGACSITDLPKGLPRGSPVQVHFAYDRSGRLDVRAVHVTSGTWAQTRIDRDGGLDAELIEINQDLLQRLVVA